MADEIVPSNYDLPQLRKLERDNNLFVMAGTIANNVFRSQDVPISDIYYFSIGYDRISIDIEKTDDGNAVLQTLTDFDKSVYDAVCSLDMFMSARMKPKAIEGKVAMEKTLGRTMTEEEVYDFYSHAEDYSATFSAKHIYNILLAESGIRSGGLKSTLSTLTEIENSIKKMSKLSTRIRYTNESGYEKEPSGHLLDVVWDTERMYVMNPTTRAVEQRDVTYFKLISRPLLMQYALYRKYLSLVPYDVIRLSSVNKTPDNIMIITYIMNKILDNGFSDIPSEHVYVDYETLYELTNTEGATPKRRLRAVVDKVLDGWVETGFIEYWNVAEVSKSKRAIPLVVEIVPRGNYTYAHIISRLEKSGVAFLKK